MNEGILAAGPRCRECDVQSVTAVELGLQKAEQRGAVGGGWRRVGSRLPPWPDPPFHVATIVYCLFFLFVSVRGPAAAVDERGLDLQFWLFVFFLMRKTHSRDRNLDPSTQRPDRTGSDRTEEPIVLSTLHLIGSGASSFDGPRRIVGGLHLASRSRWLPPVFYTPPLVSSSSFFSSS